MDKIFHNPDIKGEIRAISSKSEAHRALICASLGDKETFIECTDTNADIDATASCLCALGANIDRVQNGFTVKPIGEVRRGACLDCNESGSTLRFLLPVAAALRSDCSFAMHGRLPHRPLSPLYELLNDNGVCLSAMGSNPLTVSGGLRSGNYSIAANVSSQYISGLLFALSVTEGESSLCLLGKVESAPYIDMTVDTLAAFGDNVSYDKEQNGFIIKGSSRLCSPEKISVGGDWSNAAFFLCAGAIGKKSITVSNLDLSSRQGDRAVLHILSSMGAKISTDGDNVTVFPSKLTAVDVDAANIPDLVPILATVASVSAGQTKIYNAGRLRLKESDRIESVCSFLSSLGADITATDDGMIINGKERLDGGEACSFGDHRIAMSAAIASLVCTYPVTISQFEAINKSYPSFLDNFNTLVREDIA